MKRRAAVLLILAGTQLLGCPADIPAAAPIACAEIQLKRDEARAARLSTYEKVRDELDYQQARARATGTPGHLSARNRLLDQLGKDLQAIDDKFTAQCAATNGAAPAASPSPVTDAAPPAGRQLSVRVY